MGRAAEWHVWHGRGWRLAAWIAASLFSPASLLAQTRAMSAADPDATIVVTGRRDALKLDDHPEVTGRSALSIRETPASVEVLTRRDMEVRGLRTAREAFDGVVGATSGNVPGNPAVISLRGFTGNAVSVLQDGVRLSASTIAQRDTGTWHYERIEVLKGPASVLYGEGALAGVVNKVTRKPEIGERHLEALVSAGSFGTVTAASGVNLPLSPRIAVRADASYQRSDSLYHVENNRTFSAGLTASALWRPDSRLSLLVAVDHFEDGYGSTYQGLPLIPEAYALRATKAVRSSGGLVADRTLRRRNYNPAGARSFADESTLRARLDWRPDGHWSVALDFAGYTADRGFLLADDQSFSAPTAAFPHGSFRQSYQDFRHDHRFWSGRVVVGHVARFGAIGNRFSLGAERNRTDLVSLRQQAPSSVLPAVDIRKPAVLPIPTGAGIFGVTDVTFDSALDQSAVFAEDALNLMPHWLLVGGLRWDHIDLDRATTQNASRLTDRNRRTFDPVSWRVGTTVDATRDLALYAQHTTAVSPVSSLLLASIANSRFGLTQGRSQEVGFKAGGWAGRLSVTGAAYRIVQRNILTRDPTNPAVSVQGGRQSSRGVELSAVLIPSSSLRLSGGASYTRARYDSLFELAGGKRIDRRGNRPINVPQKTFTAAALYTVQRQVTLGAFVRHAGNFYTDTANTIRVAGHTVFDASLSVPIEGRASITLRGRNLTNQFYGEYSGYPSTNVYIGAPRSVELALTSRF